MHMDAHYTFPNNKIPATEHLYNKLSKMSFGKVFKATNTCKVSLYRCDETDIYVKAGKRPVAFVVSD